MHPVTRKLFLYHAALFAGCGTGAAGASGRTSGTVPLAYIARLYSMRLATFGKMVSLENKYNKLEFETNSRRAWINGVMVWLHYPCRKAGSGWGIKQADFSKGIDPILRFYAHAKGPVPQVVMLDPGHGGKDTGAIGKSKIHEKTVVLDISARVKKHLEAKKIHVRLTRTSDTYPSLQQRSDLAYRTGADLFISIHADGAGDPRACGVETFIQTAAGYDSSNHYGQPGDKSPQKGNQHDAANAALGFSIQSNLVKAAKRDDRGLRRARFAVLKNAPCPAALVECGFLTNPDEESLLNTASYRENVARGISNGIIGYLTLVKRTRK
ncbi:MAG: N-acetylmuramoyl-L-alanine amidase [Kiritimatiellales bacterium]|nr:N-acetylmuramoyl-L-alanine amidase [Pontiella sp.]NNJ70557.1 N-acetylmuramoyl-L-alanine amidase [Kiritimatiellales bacterium]